MEDTTVQAAQIPRAPSLSREDSEGDDLVMDVSGTTLDSSSQNAFAQVASLKQQALAATGKHDSSRTSLGEKSDHNIPLNDQENDGHEHEPVLSATTRLASTRISELTLPAPLNLRNSTSDGEWDHSSQESRQTLTSSTVGASPTDPTTLSSKHGSAPTSISSITPVHTSIDRHAREALHASAEELKTNKDGTEMHTAINLEHISKTDRHSVASALQVEREPAARLAEHTHARGFVNARETLKETKLYVTSGELPDWLQGELFTVGPGLFDISYARQSEDGSETCYYTFGHWFDNIPLVQKLEIDGRRNTVRYRSRITARRLERKIRENGGYLPDRPATLFRSDTNQSFFAGLFKSSSKPPKADAEACSAMIHTKFPLYGETDFIYCQNQSNLVQQLDPRDLTPVGIFSWDSFNPLFKGAQATPHARYDPRTGEMLVVTMDAGYTSTDYHICSFTARDRGASGQRIYTINHPRPSLMHSFAITPRYIILVVFPFRSSLSGLKYYRNAAQLDALNFAPDEHTMFYVISRAERQLIGSYKSEACFSMHHINAFEDEIDGIQVDMVCYDDDTIARQLTLDKLRNPSQMGQLQKGEVRRYELLRLGEERTKITVLAPGAYQPSTCYYTRLLDSCLELPCVNPRYIGAPYRYVYGVSMSLATAGKSGALWDTIIKADLDTCLASAYWHRPNCYPSEPIFVPNRHVDVDRTEVFIAEKEDDGVLLTIVYDAKRHASSLVVIDALHMTELASIDLPQPVPPSFGHGSFLDAHAPQ